MICWEDSQDLKYSCTQLWFITAKGYKANSEKAKEHCRMSKENRYKLPTVLSQWTCRVTQDMLNSSNKFWQHNVKCCQPDNLIRESVPDHISTLYLACTHIPGSTRKADVQHKTYCLHSLGTVRHSEIVSVNGGNSHETPNASQGPTL